MASSPRSDRPSRPLLFFLLLLVHLTFPPWGRLAVTLPPSSFSPLSVRGACVCLRRFATRSPRSDPLSLSGPDGDDESATRRWKRVRCREVYTHSETDDDMNEGDELRERERKGEGREGGGEARTAALHLALAPQDGQEDNARRPEDLEALDGEGRVLLEAGLAAVRARGEDREREEAVDRVEGDAEEVVEEAGRRGVQPARGKSASARGGGEGERERERGRTPRGGRPGPGYSRRRARST